MDARAPEGSRFGHDGEDAQISYRGTEAVQVKPVRATRISCPRLCRRDLLCMRLPPATQSRRCACPGCRFAILLRAVFPGVV